jgi:putative acetyltransferase
MRATHDSGMRALTVELTYRRALGDDVERLFKLRRRSILALAPRGMPATEAAAWAEALAVSGMERKISELEIWLAVAGDAVAGWGAIHGDRLEGLYTDPDWAGRGVGTRLLLHLEALMRGRGVTAICADASPNAEAFYLRRGYAAFKNRTPKGAQPIRKRLA